MYDRQSKMIILDAMDLMTGEITGALVTIDPRIPFATRPVMRGTEIVFHAPDTYGGGPTAIVKQSGKEIVMAKRQAVADGASA